MSHSTIDRLQRGLFAMLSGVADVVAWAGGERPRGTGTLLSLAIADSSSRVLSVLRLYPADAAQVEIGAVAPGDIAGVDLNGYRVRHHVGATETPEDVRDALLTRIASAEPGVTVAAVGANTIALTVASPTGSIWSLAASGVATIVEDSVETMPDAVEVTFSRELYTVDLEAFSRLLEPRYSAHTIITQARARIASQNHVDALSLLGVQAWSVGNAIDISAIAGAHWESRARLTVECALRATSVEAVSTIESATIAVEVIGGFDAQPPAPPSPDPEPEPEFDPYTVDGLWLDADPANVDAIFSDAAGTAPVSNGGSVGRLANAAGSGFWSQATTASQPDYVAAYAGFGGKPAILANGGVNEFLDDPTATPTITTGGAVSSTTYFVVDPRGTTANNHYLWHAQNTVFALQTGDGTAQLGYFHTASGTWGLIGAPITEPQILTFVAEAGVSCRVHRNGVLLGSGAYAAAATLIGRQLLIGTQFNTYLARLLSYVGVHDEETLEYMHAGLLEGYAV